MSKTTAELELGALRGRLGLLVRQLGGSSDNASTEDDLAFLKRLALARTLWIRVQGFSQEARCSQENLVDSVVLDITQGDTHVVVEVHRPNLFGVSMLTEESGYGTGADVVVGSSDAAFAEVKRSLTTKTVEPKGEES